MKECVSRHYVSSIFLFIYLSQSSITYLCFHTVQCMWMLKGPLTFWAEDINPVTVIHLISTDNKLKTLTHENETLLLTKLALFSGGKWSILNTKQSIKVNDPAIHKSVTAEHCCINQRTYRLVKLISSLRPYSISRSLVGVGPRGLNPLVGLN